MDLPPPLVAALARLGITLVATEDASGALRMADDGTEPCVRVLLAPADVRDWVREHVATHPGDDPWVSLAIELSERLGGDPDLRGELHAGGLRRARGRVVSFEERDPPGRSWLAGLPGRADLVWSPTPGIPSRSG